MNTKIAKLIAFELGLIIAILTWLALPTLRESEPRRATQRQAQSPPDSFGNVAPIFNPRGSRLYAANDFNGQTTTDLLDEQAAALNQEDKPPIVIEREANTYPANSHVAEESEPYYEEATPYSYNNGAAYSDNMVTPYLGNSVPIIPEPVLDDPYYYNPYSQYSQPIQVIIVSNSRSFNRRSRSFANRRGAEGCNMMAPQREPIRQPHMRPRMGNGAPILVSNPSRQGRRGRVVSPVAPMPAPRGRVAARMPAPRGGVNAHMTMPKSGVSAARPNMVAQTSRPIQARRGHWTP
jgi:hypothetical protein